MKKTSSRTLVLVAALLAGAAASAQTFWTADFVVGKAEYQAKGTRTPLTPGTRVADDATLYIAQGALVELSSGDRRISIVREGSYTIRSIASSASQAAGSGLLEALGGKLRGLLRGSAGANGVAGVRASEAATAPVFMTGGDEARKRAETALEAGNYEAAVRDFGYALEEALPGEEGRIRTMLASALLMTGRPAMALGTLRGGEREDDPAVVVLEATILLAAGAPQEALAVIGAGFGSSGAGASLASPGLAAEVAELEGLALETMGFSREAAEAYRRCIAAAPASPAADRSGKRLAALGY